ncbi:MAG: hypothetical protein K6L76_12155 [Agarilytica sp.]
MSAAPDQSSSEVDALRQQNEVLKLLLQSSLTKNIQDEKIGRVFHDFNNILSSSMGYSNLAVERARASGDEKLARYLDNIERAGIRARDLVRDSLDARRDARNSLKTALGILSDLMPMDNIPASDHVYFGEKHLYTAVAFLLSLYDTAALEATAEVIEDFNCPACSADFRGVQVKISCSNLVKKADANESNFALAKLMVNSQGGHLCESLVQDKQFDVYLRAVTPD